MGKDCLQQPRYRGEQTFATVDVATQHTQPHTQRPPKDQKIKDTHPATHTHPHTQPHTSNLQPTNIASQAHSTQQEPLPLLLWGAKKKKKRQRTKNQRFWENLRVPLQKFKKVFQTVPVLIWLGLAVPFLLLV